MNMNKMEGNDISILYITQIGDKRDGVNKQPTTTSALKNWTKEPFRRQTPQTQVH